MKAVLTFLFILVLGASALANTSTTINNLNPKIASYEQVTTLKMDILLDSGIVVATDVNEIKNANEKSIARLYKYKNSRIKKALTFTTKRNKAKMS
jgi:hypothetical protein